MPIIVDAHEDIAWNNAVFGRDYTRPMQEIRDAEKGSIAEKYNGNTLLGWDVYQRGKVAMIFSTLFVPPKRAQMGEWDTPVYRDFAEADYYYRQQLDYYRRLVDENPDKFGFIRTARDLDLLLTDWQNPEEERTRQIGLLLLMEGAEAIRNPEELEEWWDAGLRIIGPAWLGTRYCGGSTEPGPLTAEGRELLSAMADYGYILDISHQDEKAALESLDMYEGALIASHSNAKALLPHTESNRHLSDRVIRGIIERDGVIGILPFNAFLQSGWRRSDGRERLSIHHIVDQIDYICQLAGDARHVGIGSDFDGGFGLESVPKGINSIADLQKLAPLIAERGYTDQDIRSIFGENFINHLKKNLPSK